MLWYLLEKVTKWTYSTNHFSCDLKQSLFDMIWTFRFWIWFPGVPLLPGSIGWKRTVVWREHKVGEINHVCLKCQPTNLCLLSFSSHIWHWCTAQQAIAAYKIQREQNCTEITFYWEYLRFARAATSHHNLTLMMSMFRYNSTCAHPVAEEANQMIYLCKSSNAMWK